MPRIVLTTLLRATLRGSAQSGILHDCVNTVSPESDKFPFLAQAIRYLAGDSYGKSRCFLSDEHRKAGEHVPALYVCYTCVPFEQSEEFAETIPFLTSCFACTVNTRTKLIAVVV